MSVLMPQVKGRADGKTISALVAQELARADLAGHDTGGHATTAVEGDRPGGA